LKGRNCPKIIAALPLIIHLGIRHLRLFEFAGIVDNHLVSLSENKNGMQRNLFPCQRDVLIVDKFVRIDVDVDVISLLVLPRPLLV
jgi:hypothetical protein